MRKEKNPCLSLSSQLDHNKDLLCVGGGYTRDDIIKMICHFNLFLLSNSILHTSSNVF